MRRLRWLALVASMTAACADADPERGERDGAVGSGRETDAGTAPADAVTYWQDMVPLFEQHCLHCHQQDGIGPVRLDVYGEAKRHAALIAYSTEARQMPPWHATSDGSCGEFQGSLALSDAEIERIQQWVAAGAPEGSAGELALPALDRLAEAREYPLPSYVPAPQGGEYAVNDDYHCFVVDANIAERQFITGYDVSGHPVESQRVRLQPRLRGVQRPRRVRDGALRAQVPAGLRRLQPGSRQRPHG